MGGLTPTLGLGMGHAMSIQPTKYVTGFALPISSVTPQTPVSQNLKKAIICQFDQLSHCFLGTRYIC